MKFKEIIKTLSPNDSIYRVTENGVVFHRFLCQHPNKSLTDYYFILNGLTVSSVYISDDREWTTNYEEAMQLYKKLLLDRFKSDVEYYFPGEIEVIEK